MHLLQIADESGPRCLGIDTLGFAASMDREAMDASYMCCFGDADFAEDNESEHAVG
jgi:hypothetical protein